MSKVLPYELSMAGVRLGRGNRCTGTVATVA